MELDIFSYQSHGHLIAGMFPCIDHSPPVRQIRFRAGEIEALAGGLGQMLFFHDQRHLIKDFYIQILEYVRLRNIAEAEILARRL